MGVLLLYQRPLSLEKNKWRDSESQITQKSSHPPFFSTISGVFAKKGAGAVHWHTHASGRCTELLLDP